MSKCCKMGNLKYTVMVLLVVVVVNWEEEGELSGDKEGICPSSTTTHLRIRFNYLTWVVFSIWKEKEGNKTLCSLIEIGATRITDPHWYLPVLVAKDMDNKKNMVILKGYKYFWEGVATGGVMDLLEVFDCVILKNQEIINITDGVLLPVNFLVSEEKLLKALNLVGLFLQTKSLHCLIPTLLSLTSAVVEFNTTLRVLVYGRRFNWDANSSVCLV
ncbi:hypothetical protein KI387_030980 [Taxus chinensis]|uniref:Uncharacterized protein n=1 Tax=Taxus chinensis TaxID=29808 RepID=A0AA38CMD5_TAXCH|nr:hypothetical protein KI387_030980 [Taxus chinensis]